jgi:hypothetical protein
MVREAEFRQVGRLEADSCAVDICITTDYKELEHVCLLAEVLAKRKDNARRVLGCDSD